MTPLGRSADRASRLAMRLMLIATFGASLAGCWPARFIARPAVVGAVVSAADGTPIMGASVTFVQPDWNRSFNVLTGRNGAFRIEPLHYWGLNTILGENFGGYGYVEVDAAGFVSDRMDISWRATGA